MRSRHGIKARRGLLLLAALCALALLAVPSVAAAKDRNNDRIPDKWEKRHKLSLKVNQGERDQDRDHLSNRGEFKSGMDPRDHDSDNDGVDDGDENAGTIASYDAETGKLVINLYGGDSISGFVTDETEIKCGHGCDRGGNDDATVSHDGNSGPGSDSSGPGSGGDDDPAGHDQGDDDGRHDSEDHAASACTIEDLVEGTVVDEAELKLRDGKAVFEEIELEHEEDGSSDS